VVLLLRPTKLSSPRAKRVKLAGKKELLMKQVLTSLSVTLEAATELLLSKCVKEIPMLITRKIQIQPVF